mgnify:CR=1 FL=1
MGPQPVDVAQDEGRDMVLGKAEGHLPTKIAQLTTVVPATAVTIIAAPTTLATTNDLRATFVEKLLVAGLETREIAKITAVVAVITSI